MADLAVARSHAFIAEPDGGLRVVNVANPLWPHEVGWYEASGGAGVYVASGSACLSTGEGGLLYLDVDDCTGEMLLDGFESRDPNGWSAAVD